MKWEDRFPNRQHDDYFESIVGKGRDYWALASHLAGDWEWFCTKKKSEAVYEYFAMNGHLATLESAIEQAKDEEFEDEDEDWE